jgi:hypothetical protein
MDWRFGCYDLTDDGGLLVRELFPDSEVLPHFVKEAQAPSEEIPNDLWALTYGDDVTSLRKFAMVDRGNVWLSTMYFTRTAHQLPEPLRKLAARRLEVACDSYGLKAPKELAQLAAGDEVRVPVSAAFEKVAHSITTEREQEAAGREVEEEFADFLPPKEKTAALESIDAAALALGMQLRLLHLPEDARNGAVSGLSKVAMVGPQVVDYITELDRSTGLFQYWGGVIPDPATTVYGSGVKPEAHVKLAARVFHLGSVVVTGDQLEKLAASATFTDQFPSTFVSQFKEDPVVVFDSLPKDTQVTLANLAKKC